jgi:hypothetical protein
MMPVYPLILASAVADGAALTNSIVAASILHGSGIGPIPANALQIGSLIKVTLRGRISTVVTTPGTLTLDMRLGGVVISAFGAIPLNVVAQVNAHWEAKLIAVVRAVGSGAAANALCTGVFNSRALVGSPATGGIGEVMLPDTAPAVGAGFDSSLAQALNIFATWSVASASNSVQVHQSLIEFKV